MTPEEHLLRWLVSLNRENAVRAIQALSKSGSVNVARLVTEAQKHKTDPHISPVLNVITVSLLGNGG